MSYPLLAEPIRKQQKKRLSGIRLPRGTAAALWRCHMAARSVHQVRDASHAQPVPEFPTESYVDALTGRRLRREYLGSCNGGRLLIGGLAQSTGEDLYFRRVQGNATKP